MNTPTIDLTQANKACAIILGKDPQDQPFSLVSRTEDRAKRIAEVLATQGYTITKVFGSTMFQRGSEKAIMNTIRVAAPKPPSNVVPGKRALAKAARRAEREAAKAAAAENAG